MYLNDVKAYKKLQDTFVLQSMIEQEVNMKILMVVRDAYYSKSDNFK